MHEYPKFLYELRGLAYCVAEQGEEELLMGELPQLLIDTLNEHPDRSDEIMTFMEERGARSFTPEAFREKINSHNAVNEGWL